MKRIFPILLFILIVMAACTGSRKTGSVAIAPESEGEDSISYELVVLDTGFEVWFITRSKPPWYRSQGYYENWNRLYVNEWNMKSSSALHNRIFQTIIGYDPTVDYGLEINHKLFYYFQYVEKELKIPILPPGMSPVSGI